MPMGDTVLQMGRWFGHKKSYMDLVSIYMQDGLRNVFRQIAEADRYLRIQIKDAIFKDLKPDEILLELRNSPHFRSTSPSKSKFVSTSMHGGYSGRRALLREPIFDAEVIKSNYEHLCNFRRKFATRETTAHDRFYLYENIPLSNTISLLNSLKCNKTAIQDSYADYARYLKDWSEADDMPPIPNINIAIKFIETQLDTSKSYGVDWTNSPIQLGGNPNDTVNFPISMNNITIATLNPTQLTSALKIMQARGRSKLLSSPQVTTLDNHQAITEVSTTVYIEGLNSGNNTNSNTQGNTNNATGLGFIGTMNTVQEKDIGIKLQVTPRINENEIITLLVDATVEALLSAAEISTDKPRSTKRTVQTQVSVFNGETVIIGGLIADNIIRNKKYVPILSAIPILGYFFKTTSVQKEQRELLMFITPTIYD